MLSRLSHLSCPSFVASVPSSPKGEAVSQPLPQEDDLRFPSRLRILSKRKGFRFSLAARNPSAPRASPATLMASVHSYLSTN